jgi:glycosyltransferase involved in cell wall biosynthesis
VLFCIDAMIHGGTEKQLAELIRRLDRRCVVPHLCTLKPSTMDVAALRCETIELGFHSFRRASVVNEVKRLRQFLRTHNIDIVHTFFQDPTIMGLLASLAGGARKRVAAFRDLGFWRTPRTALQMKLAYAWFDGFVANSRAIARWAERTYRIRSDRIEVIYNGVSPGEMRPRTRRWAPPIVGTVANLNRQVKRVDLFVKAAALVAGDRPDVRFVVVGDGPLRPSLVDLARSLGLSGRIEFVGSVTDPADLIAEFDVGVICSDSEGFSNAILEFMVAGVPAVARRVGGNVELVEPGVTGVLVDGGDPRGFARSILELLQDDAVRRRMGETAKRTTLAKYGWDRCIRAHEVYYRRLLGWEDDPAGCESGAGPRRA